MRRSKWCTCHTPPSWLDSVCQIFGYFISSSCIRGESAPFAPPPYAYVHCKFFLMKFKYFFESECYFIRIRLNFHKLTIKLTPQIEHLVCYEKKKKINSVGNIDHSEENQFEREFKKKKNSYNFFNFWFIRDNTWFLSKLFIKVSLI